MLELIKIIDGTKQAVSIKAYIVTGKG